MNPASPPRVLAVMPAGGAAGVTRPAIPSHQTDGGTMAMSTTMRTASSRPTMTQLLSSSAREILRASTVIRKTTNSKPIASSLVYSSSSGSMYPPGDQREQALPGACRPSAEDECEVEDDERERNPEFPAGRDATPTDDRNLPGRHHVPRDLHVVEGLQDRRHRDHPADADEAVRADRLRTQQPLPAADRDAQSDEARVRRRTGRSAMARAGKP